VVLRLVLHDKFNSKSEEIEYYCKKLMSDEKPHTVAEIQTAIEKSSGMDFKTYFTRNMLTGVLNRLVKNKEIINLEKGKGIYIKFEISIEEDITVACNNILKEAIEKIYKKLDSLELVNMTIEDFNKVQSIKEIVSLVKQKINMV
jgi:hypothetical protein